MKKRLRKKLKIGEFTEYGFRICATLSACGPVGITLNLPAFTDNFLRYCESQGVGFGGVIAFGKPWYGGGLNGLVTSFGRRDLRGRWRSGSCTDEERRLISWYLEAKESVKDGLVTDVRVGPLVDVR